MHEACNDEVRIIARERRSEESPSHHDVVPGQRDEHRMFDIVVEGVAIAYAFERKPGDGRDQLSQARMRRSEPAVHVRG